MQEKAEKGFGEEEEARFAAKAARTMTGLQYKKKAPCSEELKILCSWCPAPWSALGIGKSGVPLINVFTVVLERDIYNTK